MSDHKKAPVTYSPVQIFKRGRQGVWIEPWRDNYALRIAQSGSVIAGAENAVGLALDKSRDLAIGSTEYATAANSAAAWTPYGSNTVTNADGAVAITYVGGTNSGFGAYIFTNTWGLSAGSIYVLSFDAKINTGNATPYINDGVLNVSFSVSNTDFANFSTVFTCVSAGILQINGNLSTGEILSLKNISIRQILGNHALQATLANRPTLSARYNLLTYSEDFSNAVWVKINSTINPNIAMSPIGDNSASGLVDNIQNNIHRIGYSDYFGSEKQVITYSIFIKAGSKSFAHVISNYSDRGADTVAVNLVTGEAILVSGGLTSFTVKNSGNGWYRFSATVTKNSTVGKSFYVYSATGMGQNDITYIGDGTTVLYIWGAQLELGTQATRYQRIAAANDYDTTGFPFYLRHGPSQYLTANLPAINVRRNFLYDTDTFSSWAKNCIIRNNVILSPTGYVATKITPSVVGANYVVTSISGATGNAYYTFSLEVCSAGKGFAYLQVNEAGVAVIASAVCINLSSGSVGSIRALDGGGLANARVFAVTRVNGWYRITLTWQLNAASNAISTYFGPSDSLNSNNCTPSGTDSIYAGEAQLEASSVATPYQKITDWTSEAYSSSGSVYFGTPQGMSSLHNQSIGTTYNLPAPNTNSFGWVVVPERLSPPEEEQLALYFRNRAGIIGSDNYFWQEGADGMVGPLTDDYGNVLLMG